MIRISQLKLPAGHSKTELYHKAAKALHIKSEQIASLQIRRQSIDARKKPDIFLIYVVDITLNGISEQNCVSRSKNKDVSIVTERPYQFPKPGTKALRRRPVIIGSGPAGLFCCYMLAQNGYSPILLERGKDVEARKKDVEAFWNGGPLNPESNVSFGEGGAGTFSDGKLNTLIKDKDGRGRHVLSIFVENGAQPEILYEAKPHIGTDMLKGTIKNIRNEIIELGGRVMFETKLVSMAFSDNKLKAITVETANGDEILETDNVILAIGHSARDTFEMLYDLKLPIEAKPFSVGARIEHLRQKVDKAQYGRFAGNKKLGSANYKLSTHLDNGRGVYTFCMCPGGKVVNASSEENRLCTNGMSEFARNAENSNSALLVGINPDDYESDHPLAGMYLQRKLESKAFVAGGENYNAPIQRVDDFLNNRKSTHLGDVKPSIGPNYEFSNLNEILPEYVSTSMAQGIVKMGRMLHGFDDGDAVLTGVESRSSSPVRIMRKTDTLESVLIEGLYPCGEGAGYAGGIISAAVDGIKCAEKIIEKSNKN